MLRSSLIYRCNAAANRAAAHAVKAPAASKVGGSLPVAKTKPSMMAQLRSTIWEGLRHMYHGFRLFFINTRLAWKYSRQLKKGVALTRRERLLLESSTKDLIRLVPFSLFIIVPFGELLLPVALKMFPGLIPSTFETEAQGRKRAFGTAMQSLLARQRAMEFMSSTALVLFTREQQEVVRRSATGDAITPKDIRLVAPHFGHEGHFSVYKIPDSMAIVLGRTVGVYRWYHTMFPTMVLGPVIRRQILREYQRLREDDRLLRVEGLEKLTNDELIKANQTRGMRWTENEETLRVQLEWWNSLARDESVPYNTLFWLKPTRYSLRKSMKSLPVAQRRQLLGIQNLPSSVCSSLEALCDTVDTVPRIEGEANSADMIAEKIEEITDSAMKSDSDIAPQGIQRAVGAYLTENNVRKMFAKIRSNKIAEEPITVSDVIENIGQETHNSSHVVSTLFDAFDYGAGSKVITEATVVGIGARCREVVKDPELPSEHTTAKKSTGSVKTSMGRSEPKE